MQENKTPFYVSAIACFVQAFLCLVLIIVNLFTKSVNYRKGIIENDLAKEEKNDTGTEETKVDEKNDDISPKKQ